MSNDAAYSCITTVAATKEKYFNIMPHKDLPRKGLTVEVSESKIIVIKAFVFNP